ncbi:helix-turn-helix domain-containing protein [Streptomyces sp. NPDC052492]|uniref:helix-turn-helix domain-containing protein n=1 Tax=Streptomyces sp. NPDC052492 TaxID=3365691 RepID=UPI0037D2C934
MFPMTPNDLHRVSAVRRLAAQGDARALRITRRISLREMATTLGVRPSTVSRWETGRAVPRCDVALRWADLLSLDTRGEWSA